MKNKCHINLVRKAEIACYKQFLLFSQCFPQLYQSFQNPVGPTDISCKNQIGPSNIFILQDPMSGKSLTSKLNIPSKYTSTKFTLCPYTRVLGQKYH